MANIKFNSAILSTIGIVAGIPAIGDSLTNVLERICVKKFEGNQISLALWLKSEFAEAGKVPEMGLTSESEAGKELIALAQQLDRPSSPYADIDRVLARAYAKATAYSCIYNTLLNAREARKDNAKAIDIDKMAGEEYEKQLDEIPWSSLGYTWRAGQMTAQGYWGSIAVAENVEMATLEEERKKWYAERDKIRADNKATTDAFNSKIEGLKNELQGMGLTAARAKAVASWAFGGGKHLTCPTTTDEGKTWVFAIKPQEMVTAYDNRDKKTRK
jgi:hypothetical protein